MYACYFHICSNVSLQIPFKQYFFFFQIRAFPFYKAYWLGVCVRFVECGCAKNKGKFMVGCVQLVKDKNQYGD